MAAAEPYGPYGPQLGSPDVSAQPLNESPDQILMRLFTKYVQEQAPTPPPTHLGAGQLFGLAMSGPMRGLVLQNMLNKQPGMQEYQQQEAQYKAHQQALGDISSMSGNLARSQQSDEREKRLLQQQGFRQVLQSQFKPQTIQQYNAETGTNEWLTIYRDPLRNNQEVYREVTAYPPVHLQNYAGPGGENVQAPTVPVPQPQAGVPTGASAGSPGLTGFPRPTEGGGQTAQPSNVLGPRLGKGKTAPHAAPLGATQDIARASSFVQALAPVFGAWQNAKQQVSGVTGTGIAGTAGQLAVDRAAQTQGVRAFLPFAVGHAPAQAAIDYKQKQKIALYNYVKQQTGAQFSVTEMDRYESMFPRIEDSEDTAISSLGNLAQKAVNDINALKVNWHALQTPAGIMYIEPSYMEEFLRTGGVPQEQPQAVDPAEAIYQKYLARKRAQQPRK